MTDAPATARAHLFAPLARERAFLRIWLGEAISRIGDFAFALALAVAVVSGGGGAALLAAVLVVQAGAAAAVGLTCAPLVDRLPRRRMMVAADVVRLVAVGSLALAPAIGVAHVLVVAAVLGAAGGLFQPALRASLPNLVPSAQLVPATALVTLSYHVAALVGPALGGVLTGLVDARAVFALDALTFAVSIALLLTVRIPSPERGAAPPEPPLAALRTGFAYAATSPLVRGIAMVGGVAMVGAALRQPAEPALILDDLGGAAADVGLVAAVWGVGMVLGSAAVPLLARRIPRERLVVAGVGGLAVAILGAAAAGGVGTLLALWLLAGGANAVLVVSHETLLQERVPDRVRGRVFAATEGVLDAALVVGLVAAGLLAGGLGHRGTFVAGGLVLLGAVVLGSVLLRPAPRVRLRPTLVQQVPVGHHVLLRVAGRFTAAEPRVLGPVVLRIGDVEIPPLPGPAPEAVAGADPPEWRAGFAVPRELIAAGPPLVFAWPDGEDRL